MNLNFISSHYVRQCKTNKKQFATFASFFNLMANKPLTPLEPLYEYIVLWNDAWSC